jgi:acyl-CoA reductase-like NAD-dependent aldehyde dehydrogenase
MNKIASGSQTLVRARIGGQWTESSDLEEVRDPYRGEVVGFAPRSTQADLHSALDAAVEARPRVAAMAPYERAALLRRIADCLAEKSEGIAIAMTRETGKALADSRVEASRAPDTLRLCAEEAVRIQGEHVPMGATAIGAGKLAVTLRNPVGVVAAITPFNAPVNLAIHKIGPALAAGNPIVIKPSPKAPIAFHLMIEAIVEAGTPAGFVNAVYGDAIATELVSDPRVDFVTFTGSTRVGKLIRQSAGLKRVALELGGVAPTIVHEDADLKVAATACARNAMLLAGQSCVSVQNILVHENVLREFTNLVVAEIAKIRVGDPMDPSVEVGTLIDAASACRISSMVEGATAAGARLLAGGRREGASLQATLLGDVHAGMAIAQDEIFGPVASIIPFDDIHVAFRSISESRHGLQCGVYTRSISVAMAASRSLKIGGIIINGTSRWRSDQMPYGGVKDSGIGREGPRYAIRDMTDETLLVFND